ncbi:ATP-binding protein [Geoalkalibacter subterraneus]|uniref:ATP-binding protein n=1 Tax=Geoalkalibacter subterraneus TaxID=483547 RepID=UPI000A782E50|nr:ATP-binding protein [Geoalkalibacter subterraneus]
MAQLKKLPIGIQTFSQIREEQYLYLDKTPQIKQMVDEGKYYFLSRPRRFGKSMLVSTLQALFEGRRELFTGLYIEDKWDWGKTYPVIKISFGGVARDADAMRRMVASIMQSNQKRLGIQCRNPEYGGVCLKEMIEQAHEKYGRKVVILVDEYDKLIVDNLDQPKIARQGREILRDLYTTIKDSDEYVQFAFLTGVSKFSKVSVFSGLNNLEDITLNPTFATICGYTQHDLETSFADHLDGVDMDQVREWYNGYNFLGDKVYNPFDILLFIKNGQVFDNYWFATGTPTFLIKLIEKNTYFIPQLDHLRVSKSLIDSYDIENMKLEPLLFQSGYLSIKEQRQLSYGIEYILGFPNKEVAISFNDHVAAALTEANTAQAKGKLYDSLAQADLDQLEQTLMALFAAIPHTNYTRNTISAYEGYYASVVYAYLASLGLQLIPEDVTSTGRIDLTIRMNNITYILEFKVDGQGNALKQIKEKGYHQKYQRPDTDTYLIGIDFDSGKRNISTFEWEKV